MNNDELLYQFGLDRRKWRHDLREVKRQRTAHLDTSRHLRLELAKVLSTLGASLVAQNVIMAAAKDSQ